jgi:hypothetical protein
LLRAAAAVREGEGLLPCIDLSTETRFDGFYVKGLLKEFPSCSVDVLAVLDDDWYRPCRLAANV